MCFPIPMLALRGRADEERKYDWMPSITELEKKRANEGLPEKAAEYSI